MHPHHQLDACSPQDAISDTDQLMAISGMWACANWDEYQLKVAMSCMSIVQIESYD